MSADLRPTIRAWADMIGPKLAERVSKEAPKETGVLKSSIHHQATVNGLRIISSARYSLYVALGTRPHPIEPVHARVLHWVDKKTGQDVFAMHVDHPGTKPNPYPQRALLSMKGEIIGTLGVLAMQASVSQLSDRARSFTSVLRSR